MSARLLQLSSLVLFAALSFGDQAAPPASLPPVAPRHVDFAKDIEPLFESSCIQCHAKGKDNGGFSLETRQSFLKGGDSGPAAILSDSAHSHIVQLVAGVDPDSQMPKKGKKWTPQQVGLLRAWIDQGMQWDSTVSFARPEPANLKPREIALPQGPEAHPIDRILDAYWAARRIIPGAVVDDAAFARRVYLDVIGLFPSPDQLEEFVADSRSDKREQLVAKLLSARRGYADHWLTFWNDLLRNDYRGTGFIDGGRRQISGWLYAALYRNEPYDHFVTQLIDPNKQSEGFSRGIIWRGTVNASMTPPMQAAQNISQVFLGVNLKCASCHDSFVNDYTLADAYGVAAIYSDGPLELVHCDKPTGKTAAARFLYPQLGTLIAGAQREERLKQLAKILTRPSDGRLPRTIVNRLWARLLGRGLVEPLDDMDKPACCPELLDWLADDLVAHHYDLKHTIGLILTSKAYQLPAADVPAGKDYVLRGPLPRRLTAEQFCDAISELSDDWARLPSTTDIDFTVDDALGPVTMPRWIWTDQSLDDAQQRANWQEQVTEADKKRKNEAKEKEKEAAKNHATPDASKPAAEQAKPAPAKDSTDDEDDEATKLRLSQAEKPEPLARHRVVFRKQFVLDKAPKEAFAALAASQSFSIYVNGKIARPALADGQRRGRVTVYDLSGRLIKGENAVVIDVASHTEKSLNDVEKTQFPGSLNHLNSISGMGFYLRANFDSEHFAEVISDRDWRVFRAPDGTDWRKPDYEDGEWLSAIELPPGVAPEDEGPALEPITRNDFANEPIEFAGPMRSAASTAAQRGKIRASLLASDTLMSALDRPNREQVMTTRLSAASTLQALELTHGGSLDSRLKRAAKRMLPSAKDDPQAWVTRMFRLALSRDPSSQEMKIAMEMIGQPVKEQGVSDLLWTITMLPEFQLIN